jgi:hypothetical protein
MLEFTFNNPVLFTFIDPVLFTLADTFNVLTNLIHSVSFPVTFSPQITPAGIVVEIVEVEVDVEVVVVKVEVEVVEVVVLVVVVVGGIA